MSFCIFWWFQRIFKKFRPWCRMNVLRFRTENHMENIRVVDFAFVAFQKCISSSRDIHVGEKQAIYPTASEFRHPDLRLITEMSFPEDKIQNYLFVWPSRSAARADKGSRHFLLPDLNSYSAFKMERPSGSQRRCPSSVNPRRLRFSDTVDDNCLKSWLKYSVVCIRLYIQLFLIKKNRWSIKTVFCWAAVHVDAVRCTTYLQPPLGVFRCCSVTRCAEFKDTCENMQIQGLSCKLMDTWRRVWNRKAMFLPRVASRQQCCEHGWSTDWRIGVFWGGKKKAAAMCS